LILQIREVGKLLNQLHVWAQHIQWDADVVDQLADRINSRREENVILNLAQEAMPVSRWIENYTKLIKAIHDQHRKIFVIINDSNPDYINQLKLPQVRDILPVDYHLWYAVRHQGHCRQNRWNDKAKHFLYLNGRDKPERLYLLRAMTRNTRLMSASIYSYHPEISYDNFVQYHNNKRKFLSVPDPIGETEYKELQQQWARTLETWDYKVSQGSKFDPAWFRDSLFSLVVETNFNKWPYPWITEKTYLAILNHHPFLIAGDIGSLLKLQQKGFRTFEDILPEKDYDQRTDLFEKIDALVKNAEYLLEHARRHEILIKQTVAHNHSVILHRFDSIKTQLGDFVRKHRLDPDLHNLLPPGPWWIDDHWSRFYQNFKAESWPPCDLLHQFDTLPQNIQQECWNDPWFADWLTDYAQAYLLKPKAWLTRYASDAKLVERKIASL